MEPDMNESSNTYEQSPTTSSPENSLTPIKVNGSDTSPSHEVKRRHFQSIEPNFKAEQICLDETNASRPNVSLQDFMRQFGQMNAMKNEQLKQKQAECEKKTEQLNFYSDFISELISKCAEKEALIHQLQSNQKGVNMLKEKCSKNGVQLVRMENKIKHLKAEIAERDVQLQLHSNKITELQAQLDEKNCQINKFQKAYAEMFKESQSIPAMSGVIKNQPQFKGTHKGDQAKFEQPKKNVQLAVINVEKLRKHSVKDLLVFRDFVEQPADTSQNIKIEVEHSIDTVQSVKIEVENPVENLHTANNLLSGPIVHDKAKVEAKQKSNGKSAKNIAAKRSIEKSSKQKFAISSFPSVSKAELSSIWQVIYDQAERAFRHPVDTEKFGDYLDVIEEPMDLSTIRKMIISGEISTLEDFYAKCMLVVKNATTFTPDSDEDVYRGALKLKEICEEEIERMFIFSSSNQETSPISNLSSQDGSPASKRLRRSSRRRH